MKSFSFRKSSNLTSNLFSFVFAGGVSVAGALGNAGTFGKAIGVIFFFVFIITPSYIIRVLLRK